MITLRATGGVSLDLPAVWLNAGLAVTIAWGTAGYALSHVRSGQMVARFRRKTTAVNCGLAVAPLARWHDERPTNDAETKKKIVAVIESFGGQR